MDLNPNERKELDAARSVLERLGFRRCDVAACNCGGYHQHRPTLIEESLTAQVKALKEQRDHWVEEHEKRRGECLAALMVEKASQDRAELLSRVVRAAKAFRGWDAVGALVSGDEPHAEDAQNDLRELDAALAALDAVTK